MFCENCGAKIPEGVYFCENCGAKAEETQNTSPEEYYKADPDYTEPLNTTKWIILGVLSSIFCCMLGGIITVVYAAKANGNVSSGDIETAKENFKTAKQWFLATMIIAAIELVFGLLISLAG
ncbi:MAG: zinc-ribbon domain-containing protein [Ruminococcaceae bacterium]|nr:zinc-ribbon domain-containing protein [Oscillospiraceae bacterium]